MTVLLYASILMAAAMTNPECSPQFWFDGPAAMLSRLRQENTGLADELERATRGWHNSEDYQRVRSLIAKTAPHISSGVLLEIGNETWPGYRFAWIAVGEHEVLLETNLTGTVRRASVPLDRWQELRHVFEDANIWSLVSAGDSNVDDGDSYFVTVCLSGRSVRFALHAPVLEGVVKNPDRITFAGRTAAQTRVIRTLVDFAREISGN